MQKLLNGSGSDLPLPPIGSCQGTACPVRAGDAAIRLDAESAPWLDRCWLDFRRDRP